jgi:hypothetical protein
MATQKLTVEGLKIDIDKNGFVSLTDIAKKSSSEKPAYLIKSWLRNQDTITYLTTWEKVHNQNSKVGQMAHFRNYAAKNRNKVSAKIYIEQTGAIGITSKSGRYGGTYAHPDIAMEFCGWLSAEFKVYVQKEFQRLKAEEQMRLGDPYNIKRFLATGSYSILVSSILSDMDERLLTHPQPYKSRIPFAVEADMINKIVFGKTAKEWRFNNTDKPTDRNMRDYASILDLTILNHLEFLDGMLIQWDVESVEERESILQNTYDFIYPILKRSKTIHKLQELSDRKI